MTKHLRTIGGLALATATSSLSLLAQTQYLAIDLGPASRANAVSAGQQGGYNWCGPSIVRHALLWGRTAVSMADLHPSSAGAQTESGINAMSPGQQSGFVGNTAAVWNGTAGSYFNIHPAGYAQSVVIGMGDGQIVGVGT